MPSSSVPFALPFSGTGNSNYNQPYARGMQRTQRPVTNSHCPGTCVALALFLLRGSHGSFLRTPKWKMDFAFCRLGRSENLDPSSPKILPANPGTKPRSHITIQIYFSVARRTPDFARDLTISDFPFRFQMFPFELCNEEIILQQPPGA